MQNPSHTVARTRETEKLNLERPPIRLAVPMIIEGRAYRGQKDSQQYHQCNTTIHKANPKPVLTAIELPIAKPRFHFTNPSV